jgi:glycosyltransferase involved in cell wall biosynthesis
MDFSVIVLAYNESLYLDSALRSVREQDFDGNVELIVVDNDPTDETSEIARSYADLVLYNTERQGASAARELGVRRARGDHLVFLDADTAMSPNLLSEAARSLRAGYVGGLAPLQIADASFGARWLEIVVNKWHRFVGPTFIPYLYCTRDVLERAGGWDLFITGAAEARLQGRVRWHGRLAWDLHARTTSDAGRYKAEGYYLLALRGALAHLFGINLARHPIRGLPSVLESDIGAAP